MYQDGQSSSSAQKEGSDEGQGQGKDDVSMGQTHTPRGKTVLHPLLHNSLDNVRDLSGVAIAGAETPMIVRNAALRRGEPGSSRRASLDKRGRRVSSIRSGFDGSLEVLKFVDCVCADTTRILLATPHPSLPDNTLYRHIDGSDAPAIRMRRLVAVAGRRLRERYEASVPLSPSDRTRVQKATLEVMERFIRSVVKAQVDVSWLGGVVRQFSSRGLNWNIRDALTRSSVPKAERPPRKDLPPHPQNEMNRQKMRELDEWSARQVSDAVR
jgi:hypothetical protein